MTMNYGVVVLLIYATEEKGGQQSLGMFCRELISGEYHACTPYSFRIWGKFVYSVLMLPIFLLLVLKSIIKTSVIQHVQFYVSDVIMKVRKIERK